MSPVSAAAAIAASYLVGCVCAGYYLVRVRLGIDLRATGSGSAGGTNAARVLGRWALPAVFALDALKGMLVVLAADALGSSPPVVGACAVAVVAGHIWPAQLGFRGGRGVSPSVGVLAVLDPALLTIVAAVALVAWLIMRSLVRSGVLAYTAAPVMAFLLSREAYLVGAVILISIAVVVAHIGRAAPRSARGA